MLDVKALLTKILTLLKKEESKTLLWTNPSPSSAMSATQIVDSGADDYDYIEVIFKTAHVYDGWLTAKGPYKSGAHITLFAPSGANGEFSGAILNAVRTISMSNGRLIADNAGVFTTSSFSTNNNMCIPVKVFGVTWGGYCITSFMSTVSRLVERWWRHVRRKGFVYETASDRTEENGTWVHSNKFHVSRNDDDTSEIQETICTAGNNGTNVFKHQQRCMESCCICDSRRRVLDIHSKLAERQYVELFRQIGHNCRFDIRRVEPVTGRGCFSC